MTNLTPPLPDGYFAVPDPDDPFTTTCWRVKDDSGGAMHPVVHSILTDLSEADEPMSWIALFNGARPYPAIKLFSIFTEMCTAGVVKAIGGGAHDCYVITEAGRAALATDNINDEGV